MVKDFISDQDGLYRYPYNPVVIKGDGNTTELIGKYLSNSFIALDSYGGAGYIPPNTPQINVPGNTAAEIPYNTNKMNYQEGGAASQQQQIIQQVTTMLLQGANPPEVMQQLVKMGIPSQQAEQLLTAVIEQMQNSMAEQQQMQDEEMGGQDEMPMAMAGGRACIDCEEQFPQAQNLNWFYKAEGGEAFPQANPYPHMYADGGEAFPQAVNMNAFMGKSSNDFMFQSGGLSDQYGGTTDIDQAYQMMKRGGMDMNPKKKKGGKFTQESFEEYVMRNGGDLPIHQWQQSQTGINPNPFLSRLNLQPRSIPGVTPAQAPYTYSPQVANVTNPFVRIPAQPGQQRAQPASGFNFNVNNQQSFANQYPGAMQNIMANTVAPGATQTPTAARAQAATSRSAGSASGVRRAPAAKSAAAPAASGPDLSTIKPIYAPERSVEEELGDFGGPGDVSETNTKVETKQNQQQQQQQQQQSQSYYNPMQSYLLGKNAASMLGTKGAVGLGLLSFIPGFGNAASNAGPTGGFFGRADKLKGNVVGPYGSFTGVNGRRGKLKGRDNIADMFQSLYNPPQKQVDNPPQKQVGGNSDWEYTYYDVPAGMEDYLGASATRAGLLQGIANNKLKEQQNKLMNQDTVSSGIAMGTIAPKTPGNAAVGTTNAMGMNPFMSGQQGNFGQGAYQSSMLTAKYGGNILDQFEDGGVYDMDGMSEEEIRNFVDAIYAAGGSVEYL
jgi:hypothetical protein